MNCIQSAEEIGQRPRNGGRTGFVPHGALAAWFLEKLRRRPRTAARLALVERIALAPRQSLALVEAEGRRFLVATSQDGAPSFFALDDESQNGSTYCACKQPVGRRSSW
jgi:hypothetical protein